MHYEEINEFDSEIVRPNQLLLIHPIAVSVFRQITSVKHLEKLTMK